MPRAASTLAAALDPVAFALRAGIALDEWQAQVLRSTSPRLLVNASRQSGKSTTTAVLAVHQALYVPESDRPGAATVRDAIADAARLGLLARSATGAEAAGPPDALAA